MKKAILIFFIVVINHFVSAQGKSKLTFIPQFHKDTLDLVNIDSLKYDINIVCDDDKIDNIYFTGKIGFINKSNITFNRNLEGFAASSIVLTIYFADGYFDQYKVPKVNNTSKVNLFNYKIRFSNFQRLFYGSPTPKYDSEKLVDLVDKLFLRLPTFHFGTNHLIYGEFNSNYRSVHINLSAKIELDKKDIKNINILNGQNKLITKIPFNDLIKVFLSKEFEKIKLLKLLV